MKLTQEQVTKIIQALIILAISLLSVFGYDVAVVQPRDVSHAEVQAVFQDWPMP